MDMGNLPIRAISTAVFQGATSGTTTVQATAVAGTTTLTLPAATDTVAAIAATQTLTNKRITCRVSTITSSASPTPNADTDDMYTVTALATAPTFGAPTGTPTEGQTLVIRIKDNGTARVLAWNAIYRASTDQGLPTTTVLSKTMYLGFRYNNTDSKWDIVAVVNGF